MAPSGRMLAHLPILYRRFGRSRDLMDGYFLANDKCGDTNGQPYHQHYAVHLFVWFK